MTYMHVDANKLKRLRFFKLKVKIKSLFVIRFRLFFPKDYIKQNKKNLLFMMKDAYPLITLLVEY